MLSCTLMTDLAPAPRIVRLLPSFKDDTVGDTIHIPGGMMTSPPPAALTAASARLMEQVSSVAWVQGDGYGISLCGLPSHMAQQFVTTLSELPIQVKVGLQTP